MSWRLSPRWGTWIDHFGAGAFVGEPAFEDARLFDCAGEDQFTRDIGGGGVELADELFEDGFIRFAFGIIHGASIAADEFAVADEHDLNGGVTIFAGEGDHVVVGHIFADGFVLVGDVVNRLELIAQGRGFLEIEIFSGGIHLVDQAFLHGFGFAA